MKNRLCRPGYIMVLSLLIIAAATAIVAYIFNRGTAYIPFISTVMDREKAKQLALSSVQVGASFLAQPPPEEKKEKANTAQKNTQPQIPNKDAQAKKLLERILPALNEWQVHTLKEDVDGLDGKLTLCIMSEDGKIPLNEIYDFERSRFKGEKLPKGDWRVFMQGIFKRIEKPTGAKDLFAPFEKFLKERQYKLNDVTELLQIKEFEVFKNQLFYQPPGKKGEQEKKEKRPLYLTDIFTVHSTQKQINPWLFSTSMRELLVLKKPLVGEREKKQKEVADWIQLFKSKAQWSTDWNKTFAQRYGKELQSLPKGIESMLSTTFEPRYFTVLAQGTVGSVTQRVLALIKRGGLSRDGKTGYAVTIQKIYWL